MSNAQNPEIRIDPKYHKLIQNEVYLDAVLDFVQAIGGTIVNINRYPPGSAAISQAIDRAIKSLSQAFEIDPLITIGQADELLLLNDILLEEKIQKRGYVQGFVKNLVSRQIQSMSFEKGMTNEELVEFLRVLGMRKGDREADQSLPQLVEQRGIKHIKVDEKVYVALGKGQTVANKSDLERLASLRGTNLTADGVTESMFIKFLMSKLPVEELKQIQLNDQQLDNLREEDFPRVAQAIAQAIEGQTLTLVNQAAQDSVAGAPDEISQEERVQELTSTIIKVSETIARFPQADVRNKLIGNFLRVVVNFQPQTLARVLIDTINEDVTKIGLKKQIIASIGPDKCVQMLDVVQEKYTNVVNGLAPQDFDISTAELVESARVLGAVIETSLAANDIRTAERAKKMVGTAELLARETAKPEGLLLIKLKRLVTQPPELLLSPLVREYFADLVERLIGFGRLDVIKRILEHAARNFEAPEAARRQEAAQLLASGLIRLIASPKPAPIEDALKLLTNALVNEQETEVRLAQIEQLGRAVNAAIEVQAFSVLPKLLEPLPGLNKALARADDRVRAALGQIEDRIAGDREMVLKMLEPGSGASEGKSTAEGSGSESERRTYPRRSRYGSASDGSQNAEDALLNLDVKKIAPRLLDLLRDSEDRRIRKKCLALIGKTAEPAQDEIISRLSKPGEQWWVNRNLALLLGDAATDKAAEAIGTILHDPEERVRRACVQSLIKINSPKASDLLIESIADPSQPIRMQVVLHFRTNRNRKATDKLLALVQDPGLLYDSSKEGLIVDACQSLGKLGDPRAAAALAICIKPDGLFSRKKKTEAVLIAAAEALKDLNTPEALAVLEKQRRHPKPAVARTIKSLLNK